MSGLGRAAPGKSLAYAQIVANQAGAGTSVADITGLTITFTATGKPIWVEMYAWSIKQLTSAGIALFYIRDSSNNNIAYSQQDLAINASWGAPTARRRLVPGVTTGWTAGTSYTLKGSWQTTAGTADVKANTDTIPTTGSPAYLRAWEES